MYNVPDQTGRRIVVTGANSGTGKEAAKRLAAAGAEVVLACRSHERALVAHDEIVRLVPQARLEIRQLDLADLASVRRFAEDLRADGRPVHTLVNNAGVMAPPDRLLTRDGFELQWGTNFLGPFALTNLMLPLLLESERPRVATMSSAVAGFGSIRFRDLNWSQRYRPALAYAQSKLGNLLMGLHLAKAADERSWPLLSTIAHPGYTRTNLQAAGAALGSGRDTMLRRLTKVDLVPSQEVETGSEPLLYAAADPTAVSGRYYGPTGRFGSVGPTGEAAIYRRAKGPTLAASLWAVAESLTGTALPG
ncbi:short chain dehydrogenase [Enemella dayhoffiae]|uniref:Short chain dehydrogenase n=1 Tax=Enemella dayhoffiae TaxID=2016507 RepID=A0A255H7M9_9ACTN|nr:SDR family oxidoreductase [Enemella dayhoffiae]OYO23522.1 short chain dehydrogenase [Enemella dayhoffiae]